MELTPSGADGFDLDAYLRRMTARSVGVPDIALPAVQHPIDSHVPFRPPAASSIVS